MGDAFVVTSARWFGRPRGRSWCEPAAAVEQLGGRGAGVEVPVFLQVLRFVGPYRVWAACVYVGTRVRRPVGTPTTRSHASG